MKAKEDGLILGLTALVLPTILLAGWLVIETGRVYLTYTQSQFYTQQAAQSALIELNKTLQEIAESNHSSTCNTEEPPSICSSPEIEDFLSPSDVNTLIASPSHLLSIQNHIYESLQESLSLNSENITITYPIQNGSVISLNIKTNTQWNPLLGTFNASGLETTAQSSLSIP